MGVVWIATLVVGVLLLALVVVEHVRPVRHFPAVPGWRRTCVAFMPVIIAITVVVPLLLADLTAGVTVLPGHRLGITGGAVVGVVVSELLVYWAHRLHHRVGLLWRWVHQLHHSAERVDVYGAAYFHPLEILEGNVVGFLLLAVLLGLAPEAAALVVLWQAFAGVLQHGNLRTPTWLGYLIQRPEMHGVHHQRGLHAYNYANLPVWDLLFGTFRNPARWDGLAGFYPGSSAPLAAMLLGRDVSADQPGRSAHAMAAAELLPTAAAEPAPEARP